MKNLNFNVKTAIAAILMTGSTTLACAAQDITEAEAEQIKAELAQVVNPEANAEKVGSVPENPAAAVGTRFTYQGTLRLGNDRAQGPYDFFFRLFSEASGGSMIMGLVKEDIQVSDGLFSVELDFGQTPIDGDDLFLDISVRDGASTGSYFTLSPRQRINATPYAVRALVGGDGGASPWTISGSEIYYNGGRVGIGTSNPLARLHVSPPGGSGEDPLRVMTDDGVSRLWVHTDGTTELKGDIKQNAANMGAVKIAMHLRCGGTPGTAATVYHYFNALDDTGYAVLTEGTGRCSIDFGNVDLTQRYWSITARDENNGNPNKRAATCAFSSTGSNQLSCVRWKGSSGDVETGPLMIVIF